MSEGRTFWEGKHGWGWRLVISTFNRVVRVQEFDEVGMHCSRLRRTDKNVINNEEARCIHWIRKNFFGTGI